MFKNNSLIFRCYNIISYKKLIVLATYIIYLQTKKSTTSFTSSFPHFKMGFGDISEERTDNGSRAFMDLHQKDLSDEHLEGYACTSCFKEFTDEEWEEDGSKIFLLPSNYVSDEKQLEHFKMGHCAQCALDESKVNEKCLNCEEYGVWINEDSHHHQSTNQAPLLPDEIKMNPIRAGILITPCMNCMETNNWKWRGKTCYGSDGNQELTKEGLTEHIFHIYQRERYLDCGTQTSNNWWSASKCLEILPKECQAYFQQLAAITIE